MLRPILFALAMIPSAAAAQQGFTCSYGDRGACLGYGDVAPKGELAEMFAVSEALIGQLYLAIFIARLVGLYVSQRRPLPYPTWDARQDGACPKAPNETDPRPDDTNERGTR